MMSCRIRKESSHFELADKPPCLPCIKYFFDTRSSTLDKPKKIFKPVRKQARPVTMDLRDAYQLVSNVSTEIGTQFQKIPGSGVVVRYIKSSYQNDPVRSAVELFLFLFAVRYLLAPKYPTKKPNYVQLTDEVRVLARGRRNRG